MWRRSVRRSESRSSTVGLKSGQNHPHRACRLAAATRASVCSFDDSNEPGRSERSRCNDEGAVTRPPAGERAATGIIAGQELVGDGIVANHQIEDLSLRFMGGKNRLRRIDGALVACRGAVAAVDIERKRVQWVGARRG